MGPIHPVSIVAAAVWSCTVLLAISFGGMSASAGILPKPWMGIGMFVGFLNVALVIAGVCCLPATTPRIVLRLLQLVGMAGAFWSNGTLTRVIYAAVA
jgi:hypothetical protein